MKRVVVVGATDGIGRALALELLRRGWWVAAVGRDEPKLERVVSELTAAVPEGTLRGVVCDVTRAERVEPAFDEALLAVGQIDMLVYCAGVMPAGETVQARVDGARAMLEVNVAGAIHWLELGAEYLTELGRGRLAAVGSVAGERARKGAPAYGASKAALHQYLEGLRHRLHGTGVGVSVAKPGWVRTRMLPEDAADSPLAVTPERAARIIVTRLERGRESFFVPFWWGLLATAIRWMPRWLFKRIAPP